MTPRMKQLVAFINNHVNEYGETPSYDEMREALGRKSKNCINRLVKSLEEREIIKRIPAKARSIRVLGEYRGIL